MGVGKIILLASIIYFLICIKSLKYFYLFKYEIGLLFILIIYTLLASLWGNSSARQISYYHLQFFFDCLFVPVFLFNFFKNKINLYKLDTHLIIVGFFASVITIFLVLNPTINILLRENIIIDDLDSGTVQDSLRFIRGFTFSDSSTFSFGVTQGVIFGLALNKTKISNKYFILLFPLLISIVFNARVGFVVVLISLIILHSRLKFLFLIKLLVVVAILVVFFSYSTFADENSESIKWATNFFLESFDFFSGNHSNDSTYNTLLTDMVFFPNSLISLLFGEGRNLIGSQLASDVGYVNQLFLGGIFYIFILTITLIYFFLVLKKYYNNRFFSYFFVIVLIVVNFKGTSFFLSHSFLRLFMIIYVVSKCMTYDYRLGYSFSSSK